MEKNAVGNVFQVTGVGKTTPNQVLLNGSNSFKYLL